MEGRVDLERYYNAVHTLENFLPMVQGGVTRRPGMRFVDYAKGKCRLIPFEYGVTDAYVIECGDKYMRFIKDGYLIRDVSGSDLITNGGFDSDIAGWTDYSVAPGTAAWEGTGTALLDSGTTGVGSIGQAITTVAGKTYLLTFVNMTYPVYLRIGTTAEDTDILNDVLAPVSASVTVTFVARGTTTHIQFLATSDNAQLDDVVCKLYDPVEILSPYEEDDLLYLKWAQDSNHLYIVHPDYWPHQVERTSDTEWTLTTMDANVFVDGPYFNEDKVITITPAATGVDPNMVVNGGFDADATWTKGAQWTIAGGVAKKAAGGANNLSQAIAGSAGVYMDVIYSINKISGGTITMSVGGTVGTARSEPGRYTECLSNTDANANIVFTPSAAGVECEIDDVESWVCTALSSSADIFKAGHVGAFWRIYNSTTWGCCYIAKVTDATHAQCVVKKAFGAASASNSQREGRWSTLRGFPRAVTFNQNRIVFGGASDSPQTFWGSATEDFTDMTPGALDADPLSFTIGSSKVNSIRWIVSGRGMIFGTNGGIFRATGEPLTPSNVQVNNEGADGVSYNAAISLPPVVLFIQRSGKQLLSISYDYQTDAYQAEDVSILADNLLEDGLIDIVYQWGTNPVVWMLDNNGVMVAMTYNRLQKVIAWSHQITDGVPESFAVIPNPDEGYDDVYVSILRTLNDIAVRTIEYFDPYLNVDCGIASSFSDPVTRLSGLEHLANEEVDLVGDGAVYPSAVVDENGQIEIYPPASDIEVGIGYDSYLETLKPEIKSQQNTIQASRKKWAEVYARIYETVGIKINGEVIPFRSSLDLMDSGVTPFTGDKRIMNLGWGAEGVITIEQTLPLPATILSIFGSLETND